MDIARSRARVAAIAGLVVVLSAVVIYGLQSPATNGEGNQFTVGTAILVVGYLLFPLLAVLAGGLLLISLMLVAGHAIERRR